MEERHVLFCLTTSEGNVGSEDKKRWFYFLERKNI
jgi:hypothetical protein